MNLTNHINDPEGEIERTCDNCRNVDTPCCYYFRRWKRYYAKKVGYKKINGRKSKYCKFWAYKSTGMWEK